MTRWAIAVALLVGTHPVFGQQSEPRSGTAPSFSAVTWERLVNAADYRSGYSKTAAPLIVKDQVVTGMAGGEFGVRGFIDAYNATTGDLEWRTNTSSGPGHPDNQGWAGDSWRTGGAATWITGAYDPDLDLVYWGTGNPGPDWNGDVRMGDNLYSDSARSTARNSGT